MTTVANKPKMVTYSFRLPQELRDEVNRVAAERRENVSDVIRAALEKYVRSGR